MRHQALVRSLVFTAAVGAALGPSPAVAAGDDRAAALDLFAQGRALVKADQYQEALSKFEAAARNMRTFGILLNIAECQVKLGRTASAWATWAEARSVAAEGNKPDDQALAIQRQEALEPTLSRLTIVVPPSADLPDLEIRRDGVVVARAAWGIAIAVDPGAYVVEAKAAGRDAETFEVTVPAQAGSATLTVTPLPESLPPVSAQPLENARSVPRTAATIRPSPETIRVFPVPEKSGQRAAGWILGALGLAGVGAGIGVALAGQGKHNNAVTLAANNYSNGFNYHTAQSEESMANTMKTVGYVTIAGGAAFVVTGVVLLFTAHASSPATESSTAETTRPWIYPSSGGLAAEW